MAPGFSPPDTAGVSTGRERLAWGLAASCPVERRCSAQARSVSEGSAFRKKHLRNILLSPETSLKVFGR